MEIYKTNWQPKDRWMKIMSLSYSGRDGQLTLEKNVRNRIVGTNKTNKFLHISFAGLEFEDDKDRNEATNYIKNVLANGIIVDGRLFLFCGHSNSQLRARSCYMMATKSHHNVACKFNRRGSFECIDDVVRRSKRMALLLSGADHIVKLEPGRTCTIKDICRQGRNFTDGCGFMAHSYAIYVWQQFKLKHNIAGLNATYVPTVFQIRYQGFKGILVVVPDSMIPEFVEAGIREEQWVPDLDRFQVIFRESMAKFIGNPDDQELFVLEFSKPSGAGKLNAELVSLLSSLGVPDEVFVRKLRQYIDYIDSANRNAASAYAFLEYQGRYRVIKEIRKKCPTLVGAKRYIYQELDKSKSVELNAFYDKNEIERVCVMIPKSRLLYGIADFTGKLKEGQCFVKYTINRETLTTETLSGVIIVGRNPCFHPGDIRILNAVDIPELHDLVDCIVFSTAGTHPPAAEMSGGDLDGDKFFVSWDEELIPPKSVPPFDYTSLPTRMIKKFVHKNQQVDLINYFAESNNNILGRLTSLYWEWIRVKEERALCQECLDINTLYSSCVDGAELQIPEYLSTPPMLGKKVVEKKFILDKLTEEVGTLVARFSPLLLRYINDCKPVDDGNKLSDYSANDEAGEQVQPRRQKNTGMYEPPCKRLRLWDLPRRNENGVFSINVITGIGRYGNDDSESPEPQFPEFH